MAEESEASVLTCKKSRVVFLGALRVTTVTSICIILTLRPSLGPSPKAGSTTPQPRALHAAAADRLPHFQTDVSASNSERADDSRGFGWLTHLSPRKPSVADPGRSNDVNLSGLSLSLLDVACDQRDIELQQMSHEHIEREGRCDAVCRSRKRYREKGARLVAAAGVSGGLTEAAARDKT